MPVFDASRDFTHAVLAALGLDPSCVIAHSVDVEGSVVSVEEVQRDGKGCVVLDWDGEAVKRRRYYRLTAEELHSPRKETP
ncbi:hypothetical protein [Brevibacterium luteolum]|uniref:hypothetical protein n=1 Tax=Brevibacterium luteolum TaxID=199591 RepID=UPI0011AF8430|nr:hypothetical protein [Brevibacterium luteolum]